MTIYRVHLDQTYTGLHFDFVDLGDAMGFIGFALENGRYHNSTKGETTSIAASIEVIEPEEVGLNE